MGCRGRPRGVSGTSWRMPGSSQPFWCLLARPQPSHLKGEQLQGGGTQGAGPPRVGGDTGDGDSVGPGLARAGGAWGWGYPEVGGEERLQTRRCPGGGLGGSRDGAPPRWGWPRDGDGDTATVGPAASSPRAGPPRGCSSPGGFPQPPLGPPHTRTPLYPRAQPQKKKAKKTQKAPRFPAAPHGAAVGAAAPTGCIPSIQPPPRLPIFAPPPPRLPCRAGGGGRRLRAVRSGPAVNGAAVPQSYVTGGAGPAGGTR